METLHFLKIVVVYVFSFAKRRARESPHQTKLVRFSSENRLFTSKKQLKKRRASGKLNTYVVVQKGLESKKRFLSVEMFEGMKKCRGRFFAVIVDLSISV